MASLSSGLLEQSAEISDLHELLDRAYTYEDSEALLRVQQRLADIHARSFEIPSSVPRTGLDALRSDLHSALQIEERMLSYEDRFIDHAACPSTSGGGLEFVRSLKSIVREHPANRHPFYIEFLPDSAEIGDIAYYLAQESALDPRFDDFIALMQIGMSVRPKLELAGNYWDEMGNGTEARVHTVMFQNTLNEVGATDDFIRENLSVDALVCGNLSATLALRKPLIFRAVGSFAVTEFLFPRRCAQLLEAWRRNSLSVEGIEYHREHIGIDARHASGFFKNVIIPLVEERPEIAPEIYWGAVARLNSSQRYLDSILQTLTYGSDR